MRIAEQVLTALTWGAVVFVAVFYALIAWNLSDPFFVWR